MFWYAPGMDGRIVHETFKPEVFATAPAYLLDIWQWHIRQSDDRVVHIQSPFDIFG
jgi:hypothetical protein